MIVLLHHIESQPQKICCFINWKSLWRLTLNSTPCCCEQNRVHCCLSREIKLFKVCFISVFCLNISEMFMKKLYQKDWLHFVDYQQELESIFYCFEWRSELRKYVMCTRRYCKIWGVLAQLQNVRLYNSWLLQKKKKNLQLFLNPANILNVFPLK